MESDPTLDVTVIIVNWNSGEILNQCLSHLLSQTRLPRRVIIVDNGSVDDSIESLTQNGRVEVLKLGENFGFAVANNRALSVSDTDYIALLNPDAFANSDWLERLFAAADCHPEMSAFASLQLCDDKPDFVDGAGDSYHVSGLVWRDRHGALLASADLNNKTVFSPCAAAALYRRQALLDVDGFDEDYFCYVEDVDLGFRLRLAGHQSMYVHDAVVRHVGSASTGGQRSDFCVYHGHRNLVWTYIKNMPGYLFWLLLPMHVLLNLVTLVYFSLIGQGSVIWKAKFDALEGIPKMWRKRQIIQTKRAASVNEIWRMLDKRMLPVSRERKTS